PCPGGHSSFRPLAVNAVRQAREPLPSSEWSRGRLGLTLLPAARLQAQGLDLLAEGIAVNAQNGRRLDLVAAGGLEREVDQRRLDLGDYPVIEPLGGHPARRAGELAGQAAADDRRQRLLIGERLAQRHAPSG